MRRRLCGLGLDGDEWVASPDIPFRPYALMLWDVPEGATISYAIGRSREQLRASPVAVPARFFATGHSFEEVVRRFESEGIEAPFWCDFDTIDLGTSFRLCVRDRQGASVRQLEAVLLGLALI